MGERRGDNEPSNVMASVHCGERREERFAICLEIEVSGTKDGEVFHEPAKTEDISRWGCSFVLGMRLKKDDIVVIRLKESGGRHREEPLQAIFQIVRVEADGQRWRVGAWKLEDVNIWGIKLPGDNEPKEAQLESRGQAPRVGSREH
ncbi:MAG TPA: PilZ domain-containing protein [Candidatus Acidoferrales bacterium]|nr:PilZ domain-containing protein [Candidatus Acidoferrales bacterium]